MLHELLFALNGHPGLIFTQQNGKFKVNEAIPFFHPSESAILNQLLQVATDYLLVDTFVRQNGCCTLGKSAQSPSGTHGWYMEALCQGLDKVLMDYRYTLVQLEKAILQSGQAKLSNFQHKIMPFQPVLRSLCGLINLVETRKEHGCAILNFIYRASCSGVAGVRDALELVLKECHKVFYKQLQSWLLRGTLNDPYREFFIVRKSGVQKAHTSPDEDGVKNVFSKKAKPEWLDPSSHTNKDAEEQDGYELRADLIPCHIPINVAEKIFFIGESIQLFEKERNHQFHDGAVLKDKEFLFYSQLAALSDAREFRVTDFVHFVDGVRETASRHLHSLLMDGSDLKQELDVMRNYFLLGKGELFQTFLEESQPYLRLPPYPNQQQDVNQAFIQACRRLHQDDDYLMKKVRIRMWSGATPKGSTGWDCLNLEVGVSWPLHLIFTPKVMDNYNQIFRFLLSVRRCQLQLHDIWASHMRAHRQRPRSFSQEWQLRTHMAFVVDNLQHYLMADVLDSQFSQLLAKVDKSTNFEELFHAHDVFINSVTAHTFIHNKTVEQCLTKLLAVCEEFCQWASRGRKNDILPSLQTTFTRQSNLLFKLLTQIKDSQLGAQLAKLQLRVDYNRFFLRNVL